MTGRIIAFFSGITLTGTVIFCLRLLVKSYARNNTGTVLTLILDGVEFLIIVVVSLFEAILQITL
jgi:hypothetical protein